jgi:hypothetical protein
MKHFPHRRLAARVRLTQCHTPRPNEHHRKPAALSVSAPRTSWHIVYVGATVHMYVDTHPHFKECVTHPPTRSVCFAPFQPDHYMELYHWLAGWSVCVLLVHALKTHSACFWLTNEVSSQQHQRNRLSWVFGRKRVRGETGNLKSVLRRVTYKAAKVELLILCECLLKRVCLQACCDLKP